MQFSPIKTRILQPPQDDLYPVLEKYLLPKLQDKDIVVIASKVVAIHQGRCQQIAKATDKQILIGQEAEYLLARGPKGKFNLTIKGHTLVGAAGIDESNADGYYVLWPDQPCQAAREIREYLKAKAKLADVGVIISDNLSVPLRRGAMGVAIGYTGFKAVFDHRGQTDLFGRLFKHQATNLADSLAAGAVLAMGETSEQTPVCLAREVPGVKFGELEDYKEFFVPPAEDMFYPLLKPFYDRDSH